MERPMESLLQDLRYGARMLRKSPAFTLVAVITLALGIGANTAVFSIVDALVLRPLPLPDAKHLVAIYTSGKSSRGSYLTGSTSYPDLVDYRAGAPAFSGIAGFENRGSLLRVGDDTVELLTCVVTENYFSLLGVNALHGRPFTEQEFQGSDTPQEVVISYNLWQEYLGGDPKVVGHNIRLTGRDLVIAGILQRQFRGTDLTAVPDVFMPAIVWGRDEMMSRSNPRFDLLGRLKPRVDLRQAQVQMDTVAQRLAAAYPKERAERVITVKWAADSNADMRRIGYMFLGVASLVLLIACANVAGLLLARGETRRRELATRLAIGAGRLRLTRQLLTESLLLSLLGVGMALPATLWVIQALPRMLPAQVAMMGIDFRLNERAVVFSFVAALLSIIVFGAAPAVQSYRVSLVAELKEGGVAGGIARGRTLARNALIVGQVALSVVLLTGAGLLVRTFMKVSQRDLGFNSQGQMLLLQILPGSAESARNFFKTYPQMLEQIEAIPGVERASVGNRAPLADYNGGWRMTVYVPGMHLNPNEQGVPVNVGRADGGYFQTLGMALLRGRTFGPQDQPKSQQVVILNETAARRLFPGTDPLGQHFRFKGPSGPDGEVVGIVRDAKYNDATEETMPYMYVPFTQSSGDTVLLVKTRVSAASVLPLVRREVETFDSTMSVFSVATMKDHMRAALYAQRASAQLTLLLGLLGLTLAVVGLYAVLSYYVNRRRHEIGVRIAVGAQPRAVFLMIIRRGLFLGTVGTVIGMAGAVGAMHLLASMLFGVSAHDPVTLASVACIVLAVAAVAAGVPAHQAAKVDPLTALRTE
jgi:putative ABC transport system permease protein